MGRVIHKFQVEKDPVRLGKGPFKNIRRCIPAGIHGRMDILLPASIQQGKQKFRLHQGFTTGEGNAAAGLIIKNDIFFHGRQNRFHGHTGTQYFRFASGTGSRLAGFRGHADAFRVVAPPTIQRAPFEKHSRPDAGAVMDGILLDPEYYSSVSIQSGRPLSCFGRFGNLVKNPNTSSPESNIYLSGVQTINTIIQRPLLDTPPSCIMFKQCR